MDDAQAYQSRLHRHGLEKVTRLVSNRNDSILANAPFGLAGISDSDMTFTLTVIEG